MQLIAISSELFESKNPHKFLMKLLFTLLKQYVKMQSTSERFFCES